MAICQHFPNREAPLQAVTDRGLDRRRVPAGGGAGFAGLLGRVPVRHEPTLYAAWGDWFTCLVLGLLLSLLSLLAGGVRPEARPRVASQDR